MSLTRDTMATLYFAVTGRLLVPKDEDMRQRWWDYKKGLSAHFLGEVEWIRHRRGAPSERLSNALRECKKNGWLVLDMAYIRPSNHYGVDVGKGMFSLLRLQRGQLLFQFTGSVHPFVKGYLSQNEMRQNYCIVMLYGHEKFVVNPLLKGDTGVDPNHFAAFINEPSPPPWQPGDVVRDEKGRNALIKSYSHSTGEYEVEYAKGDRTKLSALTLSNHS